MTNPKKEPVAGVAGGPENSDAPQTEPIVVNVANLTLGQLDEAEKLERTGVCGRLVSLAFVALRGTDPRFSTVAKCKALTFHDVRIEENFDEEGPTAEPA